MQLIYSALCLHDFVIHAASAHIPVNLSCSLLFKEINFSQNTAAWMQSMRAHKLTQAQNLGSYARLIQLQKLHAGEVWYICVGRRHSSVMRGFVLFRLKLIFFNNSHTIDTFKVLSADHLKSSYQFSH